MRRRFAARLAQSIVVTYIVATIAFFVIRAAPGDPFSYSQRPLPPAVLQQLREEFGFNQPVSVQYVRYLANVARGNPGWSFVKQKRVSAALAEAVPRTLLLAGVNVWVFHNTVYRSIADWDLDPVPPRRARVGAGVALALWAILITLGRMIPYQVYWFN